MYLNILSTLFLIISIDSSYGIYYTISKDEYNIAGSPMQFNVTVTESASPFAYRFDLFENVTESSISLQNSLRITKNYIFPNITKPGVYRLRVQVFMVMLNVFDIMRINGPSHIDFEIRDELGGNIKYNQVNLRQSAHRDRLVSCWNEINFVSEIDDFHDYYEDVDYKWFLNGTLLPNITGNQLNYTLQTENFFNITTTFIAISKDNLTTSGRNELNVKAFKGLDSLKATGIPNISWKRNKNLEIYVNFINGTKPFWFCFQIFSNDKTILTCNDPTETFEDSFKVSKRFSRNGTYYLKIKAGNIVTKLDKSFTISVIDFEKKSQMIFVILPIVAFILILSILLAGILYYMSKRKNMIIEVADFNFETRSQAGSEVSLFRRLSNIFTSSIKERLIRNQDTQFKRLDSSVSSFEEAS